MTRRKQIGETSYGPGSGSIVARAMPRSVALTPEQRRACLAYRAAHREKLAADREALAAWERMGAQIVLLQRTGMGQARIKEVLGLPPHFRYSQAQVDGLNALAREGRDKP